MTRAQLLQEYPALNDYQQLSGQTAMYPGQGCFNGFLYCLLKLTGEAGEVSEKVGKLLRSGVMPWDTPPQQWPEDVRTEIKKELGDVLWYVSGLAREMGWTLQEVAEANLNKLESRQERGLLHGDGDNR
jgi:NTP pyrophosphatase (non-canonical NTP hydrolase)